MTPSSSIDNITNSSSANRKFNAENSHCDDSFFVIFTNIINIFIGKFCKIARFALRPDHSPLFHGINNVIHAGSNKKMIGVAALPVVATMTDKHFVWNWTNRYGVCKSVSLFIFKSNLKSSISTVPSFAYISSPWPAFQFVPNPNLRPKSFFVIFISTMKVFWIAAAPKITGMPHRSRWLLSVMQKISNARSWIRSSGHFKLPMPIWCHPTHPRPTFIWPSLVNLGQKSFFDPFWISALSVNHVIQHIYRFQERQ